MREQLLEKRESVYKSVQDMSLEDYETTRSAMARMKLINKDIRAIERELERREEENK